VDAAIVAGLFGQIAEMLVDGKRPHLSTHPADVRFDVVTRHGDRLR